MLPSQERLSSYTDAYRARRYQASLSCLVGRVRFNAACAPRAGAWIEARSWPIRCAHQSRFLLQVKPQSCARGLTFLLHTQALASIQISSPPSKERTSSRFSNSKDHCCMQRLMMMISPGRSPRIQVVNFRIWVFVNAVTRHRSHACDPAVFCWSTNLSSRRCYHSFSVIEL